MSVLSNITITQATALGLSTIGRMDYFVDASDFKLKAYDESNVLLEQITVLTDLDAYPFTPVVPLNWDGPPMSVQDALDELARRVRDNEEEINLLTTSYNRRGAVIDIADNTLAPPTEVLNDRYILDFTGASNIDWDGASAGDIVEFDGALWVSVTPVEGYVAYVDNQNKDALYTDDGSPAWELRTIAVENHNDLQNIQGGAVGDYQHLTAAEKANITGSVTVHSDVNSAGSGDIITTGERNNLPTTDQKAALLGTDGTPNNGNRYVTNSDPRLSASTPIYGSEFQLFESPAISINTTNTFSSKISGNTTVLPVGKYEIDINYGWSLDATNENFGSRLSFDGSLLGSAQAYGTIHIHNQEPKESGGADPDGRGTNQIFSFSKKFYVDVAVAGVKALVLEYRCEDAGNEAAMWDTVIKIIRVS